jgi:NADH:ubiquinone oxidoreductase subunit 2 (subunit N)
VTLLLLLATGAIGAAGTAWAIPRGGRTARAGALVGFLALLLVAALAASIGGAAGDALWNGALVPDRYLRFVMTLWALDAVLLATIAWLLRGIAGLRGLLPAMLATVTGTAVALAATSPVVGALGAAGAGLAALPLLLAAPRPSTAGSAAREVRASVVPAALLLCVAAIAPVAARLVFVDPGGSSSAPGATPVVAVGFSTLVVVLAVAARGGVIPFHVRVARLADAAPPIALPLLVAWIPLPLAVVALGIVDGLIAPLALPLGGEQALIVALALVALAAAAMAAFIQDDLRHAVGYLVVAEAGLVLLGFAALDPAAWGPARVWLVVLAASKTALGAWVAVMEDRFESRGVPDLRGWVRPAPILAVALLLIAVATFGLPGWVAFETRGSLASLAAGGPWNALLVLAGFLTLPTYLRLLALGFGPATSHVDRAAPERIARIPRGVPRRGRRPADTLPVEQEGAPVAASTAAAAAPEATLTRERVASPAQADAATAAARSVPIASVRSAGASASSVASAATARIRQDRAELLSAGVLALAILASLVAWGALDIGKAAAEPAPATSGLVGGSN